MRTSMRAGGWAWLVWMGWWGWVSGALAGPIQGTLFFSTFNGGKNVNRVHFHYDGAGSFTLGTPHNIASTPGADGLIFTSDHFLAVGGQGNAVYKVDPKSGAYTTVNAGGVNAYHLMIDPTGTTIYSGGIPGTPASFPADLSGIGSPHFLSGDNGSLDTIAWSDPQHAFYTSSTPSGNGDFGLLDLTTFTTSRVYHDLPAAHGMAFDPYTGNLLLFGASHITQIDPQTLAIVADLDLSSVGVFTFDQGTVDGQGHIFVASNFGQLVFLDIGSSGRVDAADFLATPFLASSLDDVAPLVGPGRPTPEPGTWLLLSLGGLGLATHERWSRRRRSKILYSA